MSPSVSARIVSAQYGYVIGVVTHAATHTFALVAAVTGALLAHAEFPTCPAACHVCRVGCSSGPANAPL